MRILKIIFYIILLILGAVLFYIGITAWADVGFSFASMFKEVSFPVSLTLAGGALVLYSFFGLMIFSR